VYIFIKRKYSTGEILMKSLTIIFTLLALVLIAGSAHTQDAENVEQVGRACNHWCYANDVVVVGDLAYVTTSVSGLQIVDVSDPDNPEVIGYWDDNPCLSYGITVSGDYAYIATMKAVCV